MPQRHAPRLRGQHQVETGIPVDVDSFQRIHLDGDAKGHGVPENLRRSGLESVGDVARPASLRKQQYVDPSDVIGARKTMRYGFGGGSDAAQTIRIDRQREFGFGRTPLNFDKRDCPPSPGDQVDLASRGFHALGNDPPALEP
jgi:hypothetical protein